MKTRLQHFHCYCCCCCYCCCYCCWLGSKLYLSYPM